MVVLLFPKPHHERSEWWGSYTMRLGNYFFFASRSVSRYSTRSTSSCVFIS